MDAKCAGLLRGDPAELQQHGQNLYRRGDYKSALESFSQALKMKPADPVGILDNRAATYCKLENLDLALRDAKQMIKTDRCDERGYLRSAKILLLNRKPDKALEMYSYGLKTLPKDHPRRHLLEQLRDKLRRSIDAKFQDPFSVLPLEIVVMVLRHFSFKQIVAILRVSKGWERFLSSLRDLWMKIDLSGARAKVNLPAIRSYIRRSKGMLTHATLYNVSSSSAMKTLELISRCPNLTYLEAWIPCDGNTFYELFKTAKKLRTLITSADVTICPEHLSKFLAYLPSLEKIECHGTKLSKRSGVGPLNLPALKSVTLTSEEPYDGAYQIAPLNIPDILDTCSPRPVHPPWQRPDHLPEVVDTSLPNLEELRFRWNPIRRCRYPFDLFLDTYPNLRRLDLSGLFLFNLPTPLANIEYLRLHRCEGAYPLEFPGDETELPNLKTLILSDNDWADMSTLGATGGIPISRLHVLHLDLCHRIKGDDLAQRIAEPEFSELIELNISHMPGLKDSHMERILSNLPDLKILNVSYTAITGCSIKAFADVRVRQQEVDSSEADGDTSVSSERRPKLERMYIKGCEEISEDAIVYGRERGIEIIT
ncbi:hypothetical protein VTN00DRAFT_3657 [Thermoascus crustaceus]|uniref:uncharacterized protein n=1 Tax=Thermoascus crustaceus TaxID=5088 RepID=UPI0037444803